MPQEENVKEDGEDEEQEREDPDDQGVGHGSQDNDLLQVFVGQLLDVFEETHKGSIETRSLLVRQVGIIDRVQGQCVDDLSRAGTDENSNPGFGQEI